MTTRTLCSVHKPGALVCENVGGHAQILSRPAIPSVFLFPFGRHRVVSAFRCRGSTQPGTAFLARAAPSGF